MPVQKLGEVWGIMSSQIMGSYLRIHLVRLLTNWGIAMLSHVLHVVLEGRPPTTSPLGLQSPMQCTTVHMAEYSQIDRCGPNNFSHSTQHFFPATAFFRPVTSSNRATSWRPFKNPKQQQQSLKSRKTAL